MEALSRKSRDVSVLFWSVEKRQDGVGRDVGDGGPAFIRVVDVVGELEAGAVPRRK